MSVPEKFIEVPIKSSKYDYQYVFIPVSGSWDEFQKWLKELMGSVTDFSSLSSYTVEDLALFGYSVGDGGQLLESDLLLNMGGIQTRWADPLVIVYPNI